MYHRPLREMLVASCVVGLVALFQATSASAQSAFVNWETPHVHPLDLSPDGTRLLAVNTADNRVELFDVTGGAPVALGSINVGLDPVSVRFRTDGEAWAVNHVSDSISIIDLATRRVRQTITTGDEPCDVVFAGAPARAFVSISQRNQIHVYDAVNPALPPTVLNITGEDPRALATDGVRVYAAIFESGNRTTVLTEATVSSTANPYAGDPNPPPNFGTGFEPPINPSLGTPPRSGLVVRKDAGGVWRDDNGGNWSSTVTWDMHDRDVAIIQANTLAVSYQTGLMNANMALGLRGGEVTVVGTEADNEVRFESNLKGVFARAVLARFNGAAPGAANVRDLNPQLDYTVASVSPALRVQSIGDPRAIVWNAAGTRGYVAGMGSDNVVVIDDAGARVGRIAAVGGGPTGLALDEGRGRLYVLSKFSATIATIDTLSDTVISSRALFDPTPAAIRAGRPFLYNTHLTSGTGHVSCGTCHIDGRMDQIAWDLGNPAAEPQVFRGTCNFGTLGGCEDPHPMKGPMTTQTLVGIIGVEPLHWRGDRLTIEEFNQTYVKLLARDAELTTAEMAQFRAFVASLKFPPNPNRNLDNTLPTSATVPGGPANPARGLQLYQTALFDGGALTCVSCHTLPTGANPTIISSDLLGETQSMKVPQLRNMHEKTGFTRTSTSNNRGFGFAHDGAFDTLNSFLRAPVFRFAAGATGEQQRRDVEAFMFAFGTETHAAVGAQTTVLDGAAIPPAQATLLNTFQTLANGGQVGLVAHGRVGGLARGWRYNGASMYQADRATETISAAALSALAAPGGELTYTVVPTGSQTRIGIDRDLDGFFDRDELDAGSDPADPGSIPTIGRTGDMNCDEVVNFDDINGFVTAVVGEAAYVAAFPTCRWLNGDVNDDGIVNFGDINGFVDCLIAGGCP